MPIFTTSLSRGRRDAGIMISKILIIIIVLSSLSCRSFAQFRDNITADTIYEKQLLTSSVEDIQKMILPELQSFAKYLVECDGPNIVTAGHSCVIAKDMYEIEFGESFPTWRAIDKMIAAGYMKRETTTKQIIQIAEITIALREAVRERFRYFQPTR